MKKKNPGNQQTPSPAEISRKLKKEQKLEFQLELIAALGDEKVAYFDKKYPKVSSTPRQNANVNNNKKIYKLMEQGKTDEEIIALDLGKRTKIEAYRKVFNKMKRKKKK